MILTEKRYGERLLHILWVVFRLFLLVGIGYVILYPILYMLSTSFRDPSDFLDPTVVWLSNKYTLGNFKEALKLLKFSETFFNSLSYTLISTVLQTFMTAFTGYGFSRGNFRFKKPLLGLLILTIIVPVQIYSLPLYETFRFFDFLGIGQIFGPVFGVESSVALTNTGWVYYLPALFGAGIRSGIFTLVFFQFFGGFPKSVEEAALVDGAGVLKCYFRIILPNALTAMVTVFLFSVVWYWNDFYYAGMMLSSKTTLPVILSSLPMTVKQVVGEVSNPVANSVKVQAACLLTILPILLVFLAGQKFFVESAEKTGIVE